MSLYDIHDEIRELAQVIEECGGEVGPELQERIDELRENAKDKIAGLARYATNIKASAQAAKDEAKRLTDLAKARQNKYESLRSFLCWAVTEFTNGRYDDDAFKLSTYTPKGNGSLVINGEVPQEYKQQSWDIDKTAIKLALDEGVELDFAHYGERKTVIKGV